MLRIAVCDDEQPIRQYLHKLAQQCVASQVKEYGDGEELLKDAEEFDIILLDIALNNNGKNNNSDTLNGMETAKQIRKKSDAVIIFVTALKDYVFDGYDVGAFNYLLKPVDEQKFKEVLEEAARKVQRERKEYSQKKDAAIIIKTSGIYVRIPICNIVYAENAARKIILRTQNMKENSYTFYEKMETLEKSLGDTFFRSHRGYLVNLAKVCRYDKTSILMKNGESVYLSKQKYNDFVESYMNYLRRV